MPFIFRHEYIVWQNQFSKKVRPLIICSWFEVFLCLLIYCQSLIYYKAKELLIIHLKPFDGCHTVWANWNSQMILWEMGREEDSMTATVTRLNLSPAPVISDWWARANHATQVRWDEGQVGMGGEEECTGTTQPTSTQWLCDERGKKDKLGTTKTKKSKVTHFLVAFGDTESNKSVKVSTILASSFSASLFNSCGIRWSARRALAVWIYRREDSMDFHRPRNWTCSIEFVVRKSCVAPPWRREWGTYGGRLRAAHALCMRRRNESGLKGKTKEDSGASFT